MGWSLYKPGQGYWVRVLTAAFFGIWILAAGGWAYKQLARFPIPASGWTLTVDRVESAPAIGTEVELLGTPDEAGATPLLGRARLVAFDAQSQTRARVTIGKVSLEPGKDTADTRTIRTAPATPDAAPAYSGAIDGALTMIPAFEPLYLRVAVLAVILGLGALLTYYLIGARASTADFLIATDGEMKKVNWSTRKDIMASTWVVIAWSVLIAGSLYLIDNVFAQLFQVMGVLEVTN